VYSALIIALALLDARLIGWKLRTWLLNARLARVWCWASMTAQEFYRSLMLPLEWNAGGRVDSGAIRWNDESSVTF